MPWINDNIYNDISTLGVRIKLLTRFCKKKPKAGDEVRVRMEEEKEKVKVNYDKRHNSSGKVLSNLDVGERVWIVDIRKYGHVIEALKAPPRSYRIKADDGGIYRGKTTTAATAFHKIFLDLVGPLDADSYGNRGILTIQCDLTKFVEAYPLPNKEATTVAYSFVNNFILRYGIPA